jgi:HD-GYP domain-containing protein (c-di-GMP phosphodiesterase class II)
VSASKRRSRRTAPSRWRAHPFQSALLRGFVLVVPLAAGVSVAVALSRALPRPEGGAVVAWWALLLVTSLVVSEVVGRLVRRLLPLAVLLRLTLVFPDRAPSRFAMARRVGSVRNLEERVRHAKEHGLDDDPSRAAETILELVAALSAHDRRTRGHSERVRAFSDLLAEALHLPSEARDRLRWSALLHDIGKLEVPSRILNKPGKPDEHEWETLKRHPGEGSRLAAPLLPWLGTWGKAIEQHHERYDGRGYPNGLAGWDITLGGRVLAVADSFETMTAARSYKKPMSVAAARAELARCAGSQFDPALVRAFLNVALGRLWWTAGPMSWVAQIPLVGVGAQAARTAITAVTKAAVGVTALGMSGLMPVARGQAPERTVMAVTSHEAESQSAESEGAAKTNRGDGGRGGKEQDDGRGEPGPGGAGDGAGEDTTGGTGGTGGSQGSGGSGGSGEGGDGSGSNPEGNAVDEVTDTVKDTLGGVSGAAGDVVGGVGDAVEDVVGGVGGAVEDVVGGLGDALGGLGKGLGI